MPLLKKKRPSNKPVTKTKVDPLLTLITEVTASGVSARPLKYPWLFQTLSQPSPSSPFPRYGHTISQHTTSDGGIYMFGGLVERKTLCNDLYRIHTSDGGLSLKLLRSTGRIPQARVGHASVLMGKSLVIWGGDTRVDLSVTEKVILDDELHVLNTTTNSWIETSTLGPRPTGRYGHTANVIGDTKFMIFGGQLEGEFFNDVWVADFATPDIIMWNLLEPAGKIAPARRTGHVTLNFEGKVYLFGGTDGEYHYNDTWSFDPHTRRWTELRSTGILPAPREGHAAAIVNDVIYVFGGRGIDGMDLDDLAAFRISDQQWFAFQDMGPAAPSGRSGHAMLAIGSRVYVLGGEGMMEHQGHDGNLVHVLVTGDVFSAC